ncbi:hypothetical protein GP486_000890 [Trichoglossum hirsutum]|uniref:Nucleolar protein 14 n=1 Tax=Trichoglossum hirsutum TaxID=265104 RepID=A0A9P8RT84_9PEZI|nr:hypothetical protein GP486_000890 [Trichoglossum hirsutum]
MPSSQLKRLKATLRAEGITGPQPSKKIRKKAAANGTNKDRRVHRRAALQNIRDEFNPFETTAPGRGREKFEVTTNRSLGGRVGKILKGNPGRRKSLLLEMQRRRKVGGVVDRRFGENDPTMTPEERMLERFTKEKQKRYRNSAIFDLEDDEEEGRLTHLGQSLSFNDDTGIDDIEEGDLGVLDEDDHTSDGGLNERKRKGPPGPDSELPEPKKSRAEVMKEVIAKSKLHKYERQQAKEDDEELREDLDKKLPNLLELLRGGNLSQPSMPDQKFTNEEGSGISPARAATASDVDKTPADKRYDLRLREMTFDKRSKPAERTKTEEEKAEEEAKRLRELEEERLRRMRGEASDDEGEPKATGADGISEGEETDAENFGLGPGISREKQQKELDVEGEDDFIIDEDLVANDSDVPLSESEHEMSELSVDDEDREFLEGLALDHEAKEGGPRLTLSITRSVPEDDTNTTLPYTFPCPQTHEELLETVKNVAPKDLPTVIKRIRTLYHSKLHKGNKEKLERFSTALIEHLAYLADQSDLPPFAILENIIRHVHSMAKTYPESIAKAFRSRLQSIHENRPLTPTAADLVVLTAIGSIFPTSDHFHKVVTPAMLSMTRHVLVVFSSELYPLLTDRALCILAPTNSNALLGDFPYHKQARPLRLQKPAAGGAHRLRFWDILPKALTDDEESRLKIALIETHTALIDSAAELWVGKSAFSEAFEPAFKVLQLFAEKECSKWLPTYTKGKVLKTAEKLQRLLKHAKFSRRPLALHHHRPLAIRTSIPKFEDSYNPDRHYDPDRERTEVSKLRAEYKRERKGAMRELRKDANFIARESLKEKKERDREYERKYKRLVAEIQGEEGHEKKEYEREKRLRKGKR